MMGAMSMGGMDHGSSHAPTPGMGHAGMDHGGMAGMAAPPAPVVRHARTEYGPGVDMHVDMPRTNLDDPGIGLRDNGRRVLTYAELHRSEERRVGNECVSTCTSRRWAYH